jgi:hypothetical protein
VRDEQIEAHRRRGFRRRAGPAARSILPAHLAAKLEATTKLDLSASDAEVLQATMDRFESTRATAKPKQVEERC